MEEYKVYFVSDLHISHKNILKHSPNRIKAFNLNGEDDIKKHDEEIINMWLSMTKRNDHIYVLGDFIMTNKEETKKILNILKSNGCKIHLIQGNHDKSLKGLDNYFESVDLLKNVKFKKTMFNFIEEEYFEVVMCHYPMKSWFNKPRGSMNLYGHIHDNAPYVDTETDDLCLNVGLDCLHMNYKLISLEEIYKYYKSKLNGLTPEEYIEKVTKENNKFIR